MPSNAPVRLSGPLGWAIAGIGAIALFSGGLLTARALFDESPQPANSSRANPATDLPGVTPGSSAFPVSRGGSPTVSKDAAGDKPAYWGPSGCTGTLSGGSFGSTTLDLEAVGVVPRVPRSGFDLTSVSLNAMSDCAPDGTPVGTPRPVLATGWRHTETGLDVHLTQMPSAEVTAPVLRPDGATFSALGYTFTAYVNAYAVRPLGSSLPHPATPDPRATEVVRELIAQVAPGLDQQCFWTLANGDWDDLAAYGIGDPRPAVPSGFGLQEVHISAFQPPAAGCDTSVKPTEGFGVYAYWQSADGGSLGISVSGLPIGVGVVPSAGYIDLSSASWANGKLQYSVWYNSGKLDGDATIVRAIAKALDPAFDDACFVQTAPLGESDLRALGFRAPVPPDGYTISTSTLTSTDIPSGCTRPEGFVASYAFRWTLEKGADVIEVQVYAAPGSTKGGTFYGWKSDFGLGWVTEDGTSYNINAYAKGVNPVVPQDLLIAVAKSLYPALDVDKLVDQGGGGVDGSAPALPEPKPGR